MAKILVVYGTAYGQTQRIARRIVDQLTVHGHGVCLYKGDDLPSNLVVDDYDAFVIAASIIRGRHQRYIRDFVRRHTVRLNAVPSAFVSVSGSAQGMPAQAREYIDAFLDQTGWRPRFAASFAGSMAYTQYGPILRWITKMVSRRRGGPTDTTRDHEMTDWAAVDRFAERVAKALPPSPKEERVENLLLPTSHPTGARHTAPPSEGGNPDFTPAEPLPAQAPEVALHPHAER
jgi:menaquinone-dependent protoporphyrinogen oxidase